MPVWRNLLGGLVLWAAHFFAVYAIASILPGRRAAVIFVLLVTAGGLAAAAWLFTRAYAASGASDDLDRWSERLALPLYALAFVAILYQGLPAILH